MPEMEASASDRLADVVEPAYLCPAGVHFINSPMPMTAVEIPRAPLIELVTAPRVVTGPNAGAHFASSFLHST